MLDKSAHTECPHMTNHQRSPQQEVYTKVTLSLNYFNDFSNATSNNPCDTLRIPKLEIVPEGIRLKIGRWCNNQITSCRTIPCLERSHCSHSREDNSCITF